MKTYRIGQDILSIDSINEIISKDLRLVLSSDAKKKIKDCRNYLDKKGYDHVSLIVTGGLRTSADFVKALALGADGIAISNSAMQAIGCVGARMCNTNNCPAGIATQKPELRKKLNIDESSARLTRFFNASVDLMKILARACGHDHFNKLSINDLTTWKKEMSELSGVSFGGVINNKQNNK